MATKKTLLEMTQQILSDMTSDEVNSITDTAEAEQVAHIITDTFSQMMANRNWTHTRELIQLDGLADATKPNYLSVPTAVKELLSFYYDKKESGETKLQFREVKWKEPDDFLRFVNQRDSTASTVDTISDSSGVKLLIRNDMAPSYFTSFDDNNIVTDSYDSAVDTTLQTSKTQAWAYVTPTTTFDDDWTPDLPEEAFPALIEKAKTAAQLKINDFKDLVASDEAQRQQRWLSRKEWRVEGGLKYPNYGRKSHKSHRDVTFKESRNN